MILRMLIKLSLEDNEGNIIKKEEFGRAYLEDIDMAQASEDWWRVTYHNVDNPYNKKKYPQHCFKISKIVDILVNALKKTVLDKFLCDREKVYKEYKDEL